MSIKNKVISVKDKVEVWFFDRECDIDFLRRKDVSLRFKILNLLSGDKLRPLMAFPTIHISDAIRAYNKVPEYAALYDGELIAEDYEYIIHRIMWEVTKAKECLDDVWMI